MANDLSTRQNILMRARDLLQVRLVNEPADNWPACADTLLSETNQSLRARGLPETDLPHLLPSFTSDPSLITYVEFAYRSKVGK